MKSNHFDEDIILYTLKLITRLTENHAENLLQSLSKIVTSKEGVWK